MNETVMAELLPAARLAVRLHTTAFDEELKDLIRTAADELLDLNGCQSVQLETTPVKPRIKTAIMTYVRAKFGTPENPEQLMADFNDQKATLMMTTGFTNWEA